MNQRNSTMSASPMNHQIPVCNVSAMFCSSASFATTKINPKNNAMAMTNFRIRWIIPTFAGDFRQVLCQWLVCKTSLAPAPTYYPNHGNKIEQLHHSSEKTCYVSQGSSL